MIFLKKFIRVTRKQTQNGGWTRFPSQGCWILIGKEVLISFLCQQLRQITVLYVTLLYVIVSIATDRSLGIVIQCQRWSYNQVLWNLQDRRVYAFWFVAFFAVTMSVMTQGGGEHFGEPTQSKERPDLHRIFWRVFNFFPSGSPAEPRIRCSGWSVLYSVWVLRSVPLHPASLLSQCHTQCLTHTPVTRSKHTTCW